jgi:Zn-dependent protease with chaperone function
MYRSTAYRYPNEVLILVVTVILVLTVIIIAATATFCVAGIFIIIMLVMALITNRSHNQSLMQQAYQVRADNLPELHNVAAIAHKRLQPGPVELYLVRSKTLNAYTFGLGDPKVIVLYDPLLKIMDGDEMAFIIGHEMGHVALSHTWLNTLLGGMSGVPAPFGAAVILYTAFRSWNRNCEFSADRAGLLACGNLSKAISALVKLVAPNMRTQADFERALTMIDAQDDNVLNQFGELFQSHPMVIRRINQLREYAATSEYKNLQASMNRNLVS